MDLSIQKIDSRSFLKVGSETVEIQEYKISSSMRGGTELEVVIPVSDSVMEFLISTSQGQ